MKQLTLAVLLVASSARAEEGGDWSIATGVGVLLLSAVAGMGNPVSPNTRTVPNASLTVERRLSTRASLLMGISGWASDYKNVPEVPPQSTVVATETADQSLLVGVGVRYNLLSESAPVAFTVHGILSFGYVRQQQIRTVTTPLPLGSPTVDVTTATTNGGIAGLGAGIAVERRIIEQISLRLALGILQGSYSAGRQVLGGTSAAVSGFSFGVALQPSLELRVYF